MVEWDVVLCGLTIEQPNHVTAVTCLTSFSIGAELFRCERLCSGNALFYVAHCGVGVAGLCGISYRDGSVQSGDVLAGTSLLRSGDAKSRFVSAEQGSVSNCPGNVT